MTYAVWDTCFFVSGIDATNCASWVQAWGSVLAIFVAIGVAYHQGKNTERHQRQLEQQKLDDTFGPPIAIIAAAVQFFELTLNPIIDARLGGVQRGYAISDETTIGDLAEALSEFPAHSLGDPGAVQSLLRARSTLTSAANLGKNLVANAFENSQLNDNYRKAHEEWRGLISRLVAENQILNAVLQKNRAHKPTASRKRDS